MALVSLTVAKSHLRIPTPSTSPLSDEDQDIERKIEQASDNILSYLKIAVTSPPLYDETTVPPRIQAAVLLYLTHLWEHRGDDDMKLDETLWSAIERLLVRDRDPALA